MTAQARVKLMLCVGGCNRVLKKYICISISIQEEDFDLNGIHTFFIHMICLFFARTKSFLAKYSIAAALSVLFI